MHSLNCASYQVRKGGGPLFVYLLEYFVWQRIYAGNISMLCIIILVKSTLQNHCTLILYIV